MRTLRKQKTNKGVAKWNIGLKKFRATLAIDKKVINIGYFYTFNDAVLAYVKTFLATHGSLPTSKYVDPDTGKVVLDLTKFESELATVMATA